MEQLCSHCQQMVPPSLFSQYSTVCDDCVVRERTSSTKTCQVCGKDKPKSAFRIHQSAVDGRKRVCMECERPQIGTARTTGVAAAPVPDVEASRARRRDWARAILAAPDQWAILDTETTDRHRNSDVIDIALIDPTNHVLYTSLVRPTKPIHPEVVAKTRITDAQVARAPEFTTVYQRIRPILDSRHLLIYNAEFDIDFILKPQIAQQCGTDWTPTQAECLMLAFGEYYGERYGPRSRHPGEYVYWRLEDACQRMGVATGSQAHRALPDCRLSLALLQAMAK